MFAGKPNDRSREKRLSIKAPWVVFLATILFLSACSEEGEIAAEEACSFVQNSQQQRVSWQGNLPVKVFVSDTVPEEFLPAIESALETWNLALGSREIFTLAGQLENAQAPVQDGVSAIYFRDTWEQDRTGEQARTTIFWKGNEIQEADIQINGKDFKFFVGDEPESGAVDVESLVLHELGHALGLTHKSSSGSVMAATLPSSSLRREPSKADVDALRCEY